MRWEDYKRLCERPDHFSRWALQMTAAAVSDPALRGALVNATRKAPLVKPADHRGGPETDYFQIDVAMHHVRLLVEQLGVAAAETEGKQQRRLNHLRVVWREYADFAEGA